MEHLNFFKSITDRLKAHQKTNSTDFTQVNLTDLNELDPMLSKNTIETHECTLWTEMIFLNEAKVAQALQDKEEIRLRVILENSDKDLLVKIEFTSFFDIYFNFVAE